MATIALGFNISASATGMAQGVNAAAVELEKLGLQAKKTSRDVGVLRTIAIGRAFVDSVQLVANTFSRFTSGASQAIDASAKLSRSLGISFQDLSALQIAADLAGASSDDLAKAFTRAQVTITNAAQGSKQAQQSLAAIGLSVADLQGQSSNVQFETIARAIASIQDPAERAAAAVAIFGRSGAALLPTFAELSSNLARAREFLDKFNGGISDAQAAKIEAVNDAFGLVRKSIEIVAGQVLAKLSPALTDAANQLVDFVASIDISKAAQAAAAAIEALSSGLSLVYSLAQLASPVVSAIGQAVTLLAQNGRGAAIGIAATSAALFIYSNAATIAAIATGGFAAAIRALLASSGIGLIAVVVGAAGGALVEWAIRANQAGDQAAGSVQTVEQQVQTAVASAEQLAERSSSAAKKAFNDAGEAAKKASQEAAKAADAARREADAAIQRVTVEQQFGGDSQRYAAAQAVEAIQADILRTEQEIAQARQAGDQDALDAGTRRLGQLDQALARERDIASGARKAAEQRLKLEADYAKAREAFDQRRLAALARPSTELLQLEDSRSASGYAALQRFSTNQADDPALEEYRKQLKELQAIRRNIAQAVAPADTVDILGA